jgi:hypothetical protein
VTGAGERFFNIVVDVLPMSNSQTESAERLATNQSVEGVTLLEDEQVHKNELPSWVNWWKVLVLSYGRA